MDSPLELDAFTGCGIAVSNDHLIGNESTYDVNCIARTDYCSRLHLHEKNLLENQGRMTRPIPPEEVAQAVVTVVRRGRRQAVVPRRLSGDRIGIGDPVVAAGGWPILLIGIASLIAALAYTGGPFPYGYRALGELFVFVFFGLVATVGSTFVQIEWIPWMSVVCGVAVGALDGQADIAQLAGSSRESASRFLATLVVEHKIGEDEAKVIVRKAVAQALEGVPHQLCHFHYLREAAKPIYEADRHAHGEEQRQIGEQRIARRAHRMEERPDDRCLDSAQQVVLAQSKQDACGG